MFKKKLRFNSVTIININMLHDTYMYIIRTLPCVRLTADRYIINIKTHT